jgi:2-dehydro-3-deoxygluconokinase
MDWEKALAGATWFHITGITPAISFSAAELSLEAVQKARKKGVTISCDLNYRKNLWEYGKTAPEVMGELMRSVDIAVANEPLPPIRH